MFKWTPVTEALPTENGKYLVTILNKSVTTCMYADYLDKPIWKENDDEDSDYSAEPVHKGFYYTDEGCALFVDTVTAWAPLPEPYKPNTEIQ